MNKRVYNALRKIAADPKTQLPAPAPDPQGSVPGSFNPVDGLRGLSPRPSRNFSPNSYNNP